MPSSRKRSKGKERKARAAEKAAKNAQLVREMMQGLWWGWVNGKDDHGKLVSSCNHGYDEILPDISHPVSSFISAYLMCSEDRSRRGLVQQHLEVWNDDRYRQMAANILTRISLNWILYDKDGGSDYGRDESSKVLSATMIVLLENYGNTYDYSLPWCSKKEKRFSQLKLWFG